MSIERVLRTDRQRSAVGRRGVEVGRNL